MINFYIKFFNNILVYSTFDCKCGIWMMSFLFSGGYIEYSMRLISIVGDNLVNKYLTLSYHRVDANDTSWLKEVMKTMYEQNTWEYKSEKLYLPTYYACVLTSFFFSFMLL